MHMITPGVAASLTPRSFERTSGAEPAPSARRRLQVRVPQVLLHIPHPHLTLPHRHA
jgi:hypothetical protein